MEYVISTIALCVAVVSLLANLRVIELVHKKPDKFDKFRNEDGLLGRKKDGKTP